MKVAIRAIHLNIYIYLLVCIGCQAPKTNDPDPSIVINTSHLDHLYEEISIAHEDTFAIIHIYSEYPDYVWVGDSDEGIACIDDVARAIIFYLRNYHYSGEIQSLEKGKKLLKFLLFMQADNGYFNNFIFPDYSINKEGITSLAEPNWWSWRALWALGEAITLLDSETSDYDRLVTARNRLVDAIILDFRTHPMDSFIQVDGFRIPQWLPGKTAADQAALMILGLGYSQNYRWEESKKILKSMLDGIQQMQIINDENFPHGVFLSWQNIWHAYGNSQSYALLKISQLTNDPSLISPALTEIQFFYNEWIKRNYISHFNLKKIENSVSIYDSSSFPQIAYNIRPVIWACLEATKVTGDMKYATMAQTVGQWFDGENAVQTAMYDPITGLCFDGINDDKTVNRNAGAESTIEALLALQEIYYFEPNK
ncbi:MAG: hypothetical protein IPL46_29290 [Saprospiraceae bacterium]|nr:hypothetical protein [Saprospiraceae bacterium]